MSTLRAPLPRYLFALFVALTVNALGLLLLARLSHQPDAPAPAPEPETAIPAPEIQHTPPPPPPRPARAPTSNQPAAPAPAPPALTAPAMPSSIQIEAAELPTPDFDALASSMRPTGPTQSDGPGGPGAGLFEEPAAPDQAMEADQVDQPPSVRQRVSPRYPRAAERDHVTGHVTLRVLVGRDGRVERVELLEASPRGVFDDVARQAISQWAFTPGRHEGEPVRVWVRKRLNFRLK